MKNTLSFNKKSFLLKLAYSSLLGIGLFMVGLSLQPYKASAFTTLNPNSSDIPANLKSDLERCDEETPLQSPGFVQWISPDASPTTTSIDVPYGTTSVDLRYHFAGAVCASTSAVSDTNTRIVGAAVVSGGGAVSGILGGETLLEWGSGYNVKGTFRDASNAFVYTPATSITANKTIIIRLDTRTINRFTSGSHLCVPSGASTTSLTNFGPCSTTSPEFEIQINVISRPSVIISDTSCDQVRGGARDLDTNVKYTVALQRQNPNGTYSEIMRQVANKPSTIKDGQYDGFVFDFDITSYKSVYKEQYRTVMIGPGIHVEDDVGPCAEVDCGSVSFAPPTPQPDERFSATTSVALVNQGSNGRPLRYDIILNISTDEAGNNSLPDFPVTSPRALAPDDYSRVFDPLKISTSGSYYVRYKIRIWSPGADGEMTDGYKLCYEDEPTATIAYKPYVKFYGEDVFAGGAFGDANGECKDPYESDASILTWKDYLPDSTPTDLTDNPVVASSVQFAAYALGTIDDQFHSAGMRFGAAIPTTDRAGLVFGNFNGSGKEPLGNFSSWPCVEDFYGARPSGATVYPNNWAGLPSVNSGKNTYYVSGDIQINHNISLADYSSIGSIPSLYVFVEGDMFIDPNVSRVDGVYFVKGTVYTCSDGPQSTYDDFPDTLYDICANDNLRFNGAIVANKVVFERANGTLAESTINESLSSSTAGNISEAFSFMPEIYMTNGISTDGSVGSQYDYITSLPPIL